MPFAARQDSSKGKEKIDTSAIEGINPQTHASKYLAADIGRMVSKLTKDKLSSVLLTDIFNMLFLPVPRIKEDYPEENRDYLETISNLFSQLNQSGLRQQTVSDVEASTAATVNIAINLIKALEEMAKQQSGTGQQQSGTGQQQDGQSSPSQQSGSSGGFRPGMPPTPPARDDNSNDRIDAAQLLQKLVEQGASQEDLQKMMDQLERSLKSGGEQRRKSSGNVPKKAAQGAANKTGQDATDMGKLKGMLDSAGDEPGTLDFDDYDPYAKLLSQKTNINELLKLLNGLPNASSDSKSRSRHFKGEYDGYTVGNDIKSTTPSTFAYPKELIYALYAQKRLPKYDARSEENEKIRYVLFDKSGSMTGAKLRFAKIVAISLFISAIKEKGDFYITYFDTEPQEKIEVLKNTKRDDKDIALSMLESVSGTGGTSIITAIAEACFDLSKNKARKKREIILITDGQDSINEWQVRELLKKAHADLITVFIDHEIGPNRSSETWGPALRAVSKHFFLISNPDGKELMKLVKDSAMR